VTSRSHLAPCIASIKRGENNMGRMGQAYYHGRLVQVPYKQSK